MVILSLHNAVFIGKKLRLFEFLGSVGILFMRMKLSRKHYVASAVLGVFFVFGVYFVFFGRATLPQRFVSARERTAQTSQEIVDLVELTNEKIKAINLKDFNRNINEAIVLVSDARENNSQAYSKTSELALRLEELAFSLNEIRSRKLQRPAYEAVAVELSLVSEFIVYTHILNNFFDSLSRAIITDSLADRLNVEMKLNEVNNQARKINNLNEEFLSKIGSFDKSL